MAPENERTSCEAQLDALFAEYREVCPDPEPGWEFMPQLWQRIEANRSFLYRWKRLAQGIITAAAAAALVMGVYESLPQHRISPSYIELLAAGQSHSDLADTEIVQALHDNSQ